MIPTLLLGCTLGLLAGFAYRAYAIRGMVSKLDMAIYGFSPEEESGQMLKAMEYQTREWKSVPLWYPWSRLMFFMDPVRAYGPLCQWLWRTDGKYPTDKTWWALYEEVYLGLTPKQKRKVNRDKKGMRHGLFMKVGCYQLVQEIDDRIAHQEINCRNNSCAVGAEEYEDILAAQEVMHGL